MTFVYLKCLSPLFTKRQYRGRLWYVPAWFIEGRLCLLAMAAVLFLHEKGKACIFLNAMPVLSPECNS